jgi:hypothetical protein
MPCSRVSSDSVALSPVTALQSAFGVWGRLAQSGGIWGPLVLGLVLVCRTMLAGVAVDGQGGLLSQITRAVLGRALSAELDDHLGYAKGDPALGRRDLLTNRWKHHSADRPDFPPGLGSAVPFLHRLSEGVPTVGAVERVGAQVLDVPRALRTTAGSWLDWVFDQGVGERQFGLVVGSREVDGADTGRKDVDHDRRATVMSRGACECQHGGLGWP